MNGQRLLRREWDGEAVLFNDLSGSTHLLSTTALWLLEQLAAAPADLPGLAAALEAELALQDPGDAEQADTTIDQDQLADLLGELRSLDLIETC